MGCSVETVSSYFVFLVILIGKAVKVCLLRHCLMESGIEYSNHRYVRHKLLACTDTDQVSRVVKRSKIVTLLDCLDGLICDKCGGGELLTAMYDTMSNCAYLCKALDNACLSVCKSVENHLDSLSMGRHRGNGNLFLSAGRLICDLASFDADSLTKTLCKDCLGIRID